MDWPSVRLRFARLALLLATFTVVQGHVAVSQLYAWTEMMTDRVPERGWVEAAESVVSGDEPCALCHAIEESQSPAPEEEPKAPTTSLEWLPKLVSSSEASQPVLPPICVSGRLDLLWQNERASRLALDILSPPPRG